MKNSKKIVGAGLLTAIASSFCCIVPILALISGTTGFATSFSWLEPYRLYLILFTATVLSFAWYQILKQKKIDCDCETKKTSFFQSKKFLVLVTFFAISMTLLPYYSFIFYSETPKEIVQVSKENVRNIQLQIKGMTCEACEQHINHAVNQLEGIVSVQSSFKEATSNIQYDASKTNIIKINKAINSTGYQVKQ